MDLGYFETSLDVKDIVRSMAFYEALGFRHVEGAPEIRNVTMARGDCRLGLFQGYLDPPTTQLIFWQGDIEAIGAEVERQGMAYFKAPRRDDDGGAAFMLKDPDDNPLYFIRMATFFPQFPEHARKAPAERPKAPGIDPALGWYEVSLDVKDIARSVAFYENLGFAEVVRETKGTRVSLQNGDCRVGLFQGHLDPAQTQLIFWQGDIEALAEAVRRAGLEFFRGPDKDANGAAFMLRDPDGHPLFFINMRGVTREPSSSAPSRA